MTGLTRSDIADGLKELGLESGDAVLVHSSLVAIGRVEGGADAVIDALLDVLGPDGLAVVPTFACKPPFDRRTAATALGAIADRLWRRPEAVRSLHPTISAAAIGRGAAELMADHEKAPTAYAEGTPYYKLAMQGGKILLLGVDQDRNTTLHGAEAIAGVPYMVDTAGTYVDDDGREVTIPIAAMAGPHRDFIGLDSLFRARGVMRTGRIGRAVCRLMDGRKMMEVAVQALREDPAAVLCDNPNCADCVMQRARIKAARLRDEGYTLAAVAGDISTDFDTVMQAVSGEGISALELTREEYSRFEGRLAGSGIRVAAIRDEKGDRDSAELARRLGVPLIVPAADANGLRSAANAGEGGGVWILVENRGAPSRDYAEAYAARPDLPGLAFNPARFAAEGEKPFLQIFYRGSLRKQTAHFYIDDGTFAGKPTMPGRGNAEVKEIISMLRCRSYEGVMTLRSHKSGVEGFRETASWFWRLLDTM